MSSTTSTLIMLSTILLCFPTTSKSDNPTCPYPCYPPPIGTVTPTTPSSGGSTVPLPPPPPQPGLPYPPPSVNYPYYPTPPYGGGGNGGFATPPPPDPILPYFPFYYKNPPNKPEDNSASTKWTGMVAITSLLSSFLILFV